MEVVELSIDDPKVKALQTQKIQPCFQIRNGQTIYNCDPSIAVEQAHLVFHGYDSCKHVGHIQINIEDETNLLQNIVNFLHGCNLTITGETSSVYANLSHALGIDYIEKFANQILFRYQLTMPPSGDMWPKGE